MSNLYMVMFVIKDLEIAYEDRKEQINFPIDGSDWVGVAPVFKTKEAAEAFSRGEYQIVEVKTEGYEEEYTIEI